jgi:LPXTG-motif cell wall-anchored protein
MRRSFGTAVATTALVVGMLLAGAGAAGGQDDRGYTVPSPTPGEVEEPPGGNVDIGQPGRGVVSTSLAQTGTDGTGIYLRAGLGLIACGGILVAVARRRRGGPEPQPTVV